MEINLVLPNQSQLARYFDLRQIKRRDSEDSEQKRETRYATEAVILPEICQKSTGFHKMNYSLGIIEEK